MSCNNTTNNNKPCITPSSDLLLEQQLSGISIDDTNRINNVDNNTISNDNNLSHDIHTNHATLHDHSNNNDSNDNRCTHQPQLPHNYRKIDIHTHILPDIIPDLHARYGYGDWIRLEHTCATKANMYKGNQFFRAVDHNCYSGQPRIDEMNECGIDIQVLSTVPVMFSYWAKPEDTLDLCMLLNNHISQLCQKYPNRFVGLATLPMQHAEYAIKELKRCMTELPGIVGIQIGSHVNDMSLGDSQLYPIFEACQQYNACVFVHPWDMPAGDTLYKKYWFSWLVGMPSETCYAICSMIFSGLFSKLPKLRVCFAHGGGSFAGTIGRIEHGFNVRPDLCQIDNTINPREFCGKFYVDSLTHDHVNLHSIVELFGADKIVLGSDYPFPLGEHHPGELIETASRYTTEQKAKMLWDNGLAFLGLSQEKFSFERKLDNTTTDFTNSTNVDINNTNIQESKTGETVQ